jgi:superfamily II DNA or RNA helicase
VSFSKVLEPRFRGDIRFRGAAYVQGERVEITHVTTEHVYGVVQDGQEFQTQLSRSENQITPFCTCAKPGQQEIHCKHVWATILMAESTGYVNGAVRPGYFPPFSAMEDPDDVGLDADIFDDIVSGDVFIPPPTKKRQAVETVVDHPTTEWERRLRNLAEELDGEANANATSRETELLYQLDLSESREHGRIIVDVAQRQRRANGGWGKLKPLKLKPGKLDEIDLDEDRNILSMLAGGVSDRSTWFGQQSEFQTAVYRYRLTNELGDKVLPALCATNRFVLLEASGEATKRLEWDDSPAWELSMSVYQDKELKSWTLAGRLSREGEEQTFDVRDVSLIVPGGFVIKGRAISRLEDFGAYDWIKLLRAKEPISVPDGEEAQFVDCLLDMPSMPKLDLPDKLKLEEFTPELKPVLTVHPPRGRWKHEKLRAEVSFDYDGTSVRGSSRKSVVVQRELGRCLVRDLHIENEFWAQLQSKGFRRLLDRRRGAHDVEISVRELGPSVRALIDSGWNVRAEGKQIRQPGQVQFRVHTEIDWFELHADVDFDGQRLALPELLAALSRGETTVRFDDGSMGIIPEEWLEQYGLLAGLGTVEGEHLKFSNTQAGLLDALLGAQELVEYDDQFISMRDRIRSHEGIQEIHEPETFVGELRGYQREGLGWLRFLQDFGFGGCLADDMGLGKTVQMLALLEERVTHEKAAKFASLIVVPKSLMFNWHQEANRFTPALKVLEYAGLDRAALRDDFHKFDIVLTTYGTLRRDILQLKELPFDYVVLDEAQTIKNSASQVAKASRLIKAKYRVALSGTPIENHVGDLWSIFEFLNPGMLGRSSLFKIYAADSQDPKSREMLSNGLRPFILRRTKQQVANDLPEKLEETVHCRMGKDQQRLYDEMRSHYRDSLLGLVDDQGLVKSQMHVLEALLRLRQAACHPGLLDPDKVHEPSAKLDVLLSQLEEIIEGGHKALVFSQFTSLLAIVKTHLDQKGIVYEYLDGQTRKRQQHVERFQEDPACPVFLISLKAGGLGLNLTAAEYVFLLDPWWNPAVEAQAIDRAHRVGQTKRVFAYRLICSGTVEEKIAELQRQKRDLADAILQENNSAMKGMTVEDLDMLLS